MGSPGRGVVGVVLENPASPGIISLLGNTPLTATITGYSQPTGSTGMRIEIVALANIATGTITVVGTDPSGNAATETTPTVAISPMNQQSPDLVAFRHVTQKVYASITSVTSTGFAGGGLIRLSGIQAEKYQFPALTFKPDDKRGSYSPNVFDGTLSRNKNILQLLIEEGWETTIALYPESALILFYLLFGAPASVVSIPASPTSLLATTAVSALTTVTTQPTAPGMRLIMAIGSSTTVGTITIVGTNPYNQATTEVVTCAQGGTNGNGVYYSANVFKTITSVTGTGMTSGQFSMTGVFGWVYTFDDLTNADTWYPGCWHFYDGTDTIALPYAFAEEVNFDFGTSKEFMCDLKGKAQDGIPIGDRTTTPMTGSRLTTLAQVADKPLPGWQGLAWIDPFGTTPQTNAYAGLLTECKIAMKVPKGVIYGLNNTQRFTQVYNQKEGREATFNATVDFRDLAQYEKYRSNQKQTISVGMVGPFIGNVGAVMNQKSWFITIPLKLTDVKKDAEPNKANVVGTYSGIAEYDASLGFNFQAVVTCQQPPVLAL